MWVMSSFGILMPAIRPPKTVPRGDDRTLQIRSRRRQDLDILRGRYMRRTLGPSLYTPKFDYEWRAYCTPEAFALAMSQMVLEIDYLKFKPTTVDMYGDEDLHRCYNAIWGTVLRELSDFPHQDEQWAKYPTTPVKKTGSALVHKSGVATVPYMPQRPFPAPASSATPFRGTYPSPTHTAADLRGSEPAPAVGVETYELPRTDAEVDDLYREIDAILDLDETITANLDHQSCVHSDTANGRSRCRRSRRRAAYRRLDELRRQLADQQARIFADDMRDEPDPPFDVDSPEHWPADYQPEHGVTN